jgi:hypothetical protein
MQKLVDKTTEFLERWFPPRLPWLHPRELKESLDYRYRLSRRGIEANPTFLYGGRIQCVKVGDPPPKLKRGHP